MSDIQTGCHQHPGRCVIGHPFNPPHLIPLVEIVGGSQTSEDTVTRVTDFYEALGKQTIRLRKEVAGHVANRLQAALWREMVHLVSQGVVSVADADKAVCWGPGLRWGVMGPALLFHLAGGVGGIEHFFDHFTEPMNDWWTTLGNPQMTPEIRQLMVEGTLIETGARSLEALAIQRDHALLGLLRLRAME
jgi:3-hydroxyacyl-CoA dehydrogenase